MTAMDNELRCNNIRCRAQLGLDGQAVVTTCSHVFCIACANESFGETRTCPACEQLLADDDDIVVSYLNPSTNYKASILAGLTPSLILEIAARALGFWTYQTSQEAAFQSVLLKRSENKLEETKQITNNVEIELARAQRDLKEYENHMAHEKRRSRGFEQALKEKERELMKMKGTSDNLMKRAVMSNAAQAEMFRNDSNDSPVLIPRPNERHNRLVMGTPMSSNQAPRPFQPTPMTKTNGRGPIFYPKVSSATAAYTPNTRQDDSGFQLHQGSSRTRDSGKMRKGQGSDVGSQTRTGSKLKDRKTVGPAYFGAP